MFHLLLLFYYYLRIFRLIIQNVLLVLRRKVFSQPRLVLL